MKKKIYLFGLLLFLAFTGLNAQTPYFYYYDGKKQYFEFDTKHVFVSVIDENAANIFASDNAVYQPFRMDISEGKRSKTSHKRFWSVLSWEENLSEDTYLKKISEITTDALNI